MKLFKRICKNAKNCFINILKSRVQCKFGMIITYFLYVMLYVMLYLNFSLFIIYYYIIYFLLFIIYYLLFYININFV